MRRFRKLWLPAVLVLLLLALAACTDDTPEIPGTDGDTVPPTEAVTDTPTEPEKTPDIYVEQLERDMSSLTAHRITIKHGAKKGKITIEYYGNEDLEAVCEALKGIRTDKTAE